MSRIVACIVALAIAAPGCSGRPSTRATAGEAPPSAPSKAAASTAPSPSAVAATPLDTLSVAVLRQALVSHDWEDRLIAVEAIGSSRRPELAALLDPGALGDPEEDIRLAAVDALSKLCARRLLESVRDDQTERLSIRALAAGALLARCPDPQPGDHP